MALAYLGCWGLLCHPLGLGLEMRKTPNALEPHAPCDGHARHSGLLGECSDVPSLSFSRPNPLPLQDSLKHTGGCGGRHASSSQCTQWGVSSASSPPERAGTRGLGRRGKLWLMEKRGQGDTGLRPERISGPRSKEGQSFSQLLSLCISPCQEGRLPPGEPPRKA